MLLLHEAVVERLADGLDGEMLVHVAHVQALPRHRAHRYAPQVLVGARELRDVVGLFTTWRRVRASESKKRERKVRRSVRMGVSLRAGVNRMRYLDLID
jgi:hypothetical protein